jgi:hypothetical protein
VAEGKTASEDSDTGENGIEEIEDSYCANTYEVKQRTFHAQVGQRLVQALEDPICTMLRLWSVWHI